MENLAYFSFTFQLKGTEISKWRLSITLAAKGLSVHRSASLPAIFVKEEKLNKNLRSSHTQTQTHAHASLSSKQKFILMDQIMQTLFKWLKGMRTGLSASQFSYLITMKSQVSKVVGHKAAPLDLQDILMHAEMLCWLWPKLGTAPRPAGTHEYDSTTCTNMHEVIA